MLLFKNASTSKMYISGHEQHLYISLFLSTQITNDASSNTDGNTSPKTVCCVQV